VPQFGAIEAGGTKFICGVGSCPEDLKTFRVPTTSPRETIAAAIRILRDNAGPDGLAAVGIGSFGPVELDRASPFFGYITSTPKPGWQNVDLAGEVGRALKVPIGFSTDVNAAALAETRWGAGRDVTSCVYLTVGTGIGGGAVFGGVPLHGPTLGATHAEMGHIRIPHDLTADPFSGACPFHGDCFEGLASGSAMTARWGRRAEDLPPEHPAWALEAQYLALGIANIALTIAPGRIILGGGVMRQQQLFPAIREAFSGILNGYRTPPEGYIVPPELGERSGVLGALALAIAEFHR
jgi:fructokinase